MLQLKCMSVATDMDIKKKYWLGELHTCSLLFIISPDFSDMTLFFYFFLCKLLSFRPTFVICSLFRWLFSTGSLRQDTVLCHWEWDICHFTFKQRIFTAHPANGQTIHPYLPNTIAIWIGFLIFSEEHFFSLAFLKQWIGMRSANGVTLWF